MSIWCSWTIGPIAEDRAASIASEKCCVGTSETFRQLLFPSTAKVPLSSGVEGGGHQIKAHKAPRIQEEELCQSQSLASLMSAGCYVLLGTPASRC